MNGEVAHIQNTSGEDIAVQFDGQMTRWAPGETKRIAKEQSSHFLRWGTDSAGQQALVKLDQEHSGLALAESELAARQKDLAAAKELVAIASEKLATAEKNVKIARATREAYAKQSTILDDPPLPPAPAFPRPEKK